MNPPNSVVVAGDYKQFREYIGRAPSDIKYIFVANEHTLVGLHGVEAHFTGTWYERDDIEQIEARLAICNL